jgi:hypothetical protein
MANGSLSSAPPVVPPKGIAYEKSNASCVEVQAEAVTDSGSNYDHGDGITKSNEESEYLQRGKANGGFGSGESPVRSQSLDYHLAEIAVILSGNDFIGVQHAIFGSDGRELFPPLIYFGSRKTGSTLALPLSRVLVEGASLIRQHVARSNAQFKDHEPPESELVCL